jgi:hypothetical protein
MRIKKDSAVISVPGVDCDIAVMRAHVGRSAAEKATNVLHIFEGERELAGIASGLKYASYNPDTFEGVLDLVASRFHDPRAALEIAERCGRRAYCFDYPARIRRMDDCAINAIGDPTGPQAAELLNLSERPGPKWAPQWILNIFRARA